MWGQLSETVNLAQLAGATEQVPAVKQAANSCCGSEVATVSMQFCCGKVAVDINCRDGTIAVAIISRCGGKCCLYIVAL